MQQSLLLNGLSPTSRCRDLGEIGIEKEKFESVVEQMAVDAIASGSPANNPRQATAEEIVALYWECF